MIQNDKIREKLSEIEYSIFELKVLAENTNNELEAEELFRIANSLEYSLNVIENNLAKG